VLCRRSPNEQAPTGVPDGVTGGGNISKRIVIIGAGYAGVETALSLNRHKKDASVDIVLVESQSLPHAADRAA
jgi:NADPH-dependent 2,4-dienoyl-CoA reductase/sulfur reductase-like enzyme